MEIAFAGRVRNASEARFCFTAWAAAISVSQIAIVAFLTAENQDSISTFWNAFSESGQFRWVKSKCAFAIIVFFVINEVILGETGKTFWEIRESALTTYGFCTVSWNVIVSIFAFVANVCTSRQKWVLANLTNIWSWTSLTLVYLANMHAGFSFCI